MRFTRHTRPPRSIDVLPLINVVFLLILFVLVAGRPTTQHPQDILVAQTHQAYTHQPTPRIIVLRDNGQFYLDGAPLELAQLMTQLTAKEGDAGLAVEIIASATAPAAALLDFRRAAITHGIAEIRLKTMQSDGAG